MIIWNKGTPNYLNHIGTTPYVVIWAKEKI